MTQPAWRTASRSNSNGGECVEVADNLPGQVLVRDSKNRTSGTLTFTPTAWSTFITQVSTAGH
ncbi:DUF397 domain-containing protein [Solwaraspora sp. WMMD937]|uniref:DUF397 domain-containing protein n=1 Tax=Solwaraspora sp. WMMD937 TaxID=3016090 RepID=UPI00249B9FD3|nr:DUF397 domain-containing protein [Solwaraspora sp. WMMD937]WFE23031.1 DUF397 domain-containing protein [Solwaraspora sp. WMMD937]